MKNVFSILDSTLKFSRNFQFHRRDPSLKRFISANKRRRSSVASLGNRHDGKKGKKQKHVNKKNEIFPHGNYRQYYGNVERKMVTRVSIHQVKKWPKIRERLETLNIIACFSTI